MSDEARIHAVGPSDCEELAVFFEAIASDAAVTAFFHPHPFTREQAEWVCGRGPELRDRYLVATEGDSPAIVGYAMLRGWDEGYDVPAFGVCVRPDRQGRGLGRLLLEHAVGAAKAAGATRMMLKVHRDNAGARRLYESAGFSFAPDQETEQVVGYKELV
jgi:ribosomal protein S18 acetylase RimI-like enzyme